MKQCLATTGWLVKGALLAAVFIGSLLPAKGQISGTVYRDFDGNGLRSNATALPTTPRSHPMPVERGVPGVVIRAYVGQSTVPIATLTTANGTYLFSASDVPTNAQVRLEFTNIPQGYHDSAHGTEQGRQLGTTVQFVRAPATNIDLGINYPSDYCQPTGVKLVVPCFVNGDPLKVASSTGDPIPTDQQAGQGDAFVGVDYDGFSIKGPGNTSANKADYPATYHATANRVGSVWGVAIQRRSKQAFTTATLKRHTGLGTLGLGGIYQTDLSVGSPSATTPFMSLTQVGISPGTELSRDLPGNKLLASADPEAMSAVGRVSIGGADMSEDDSTLYLVNLHDRKLYGLKVGIPARVPAAANIRSWPVVGPGCPQGEFRPWAVKTYRGVVYVGGVCTGEYAPHDASSYTNALSSTLLSGHVYAVDPSAGTVNEVLSFPLSFTRGQEDITGNCAYMKYWQPWTNQFPNPCAANFAVWPQPMLTDLEFDVDGHLIIGMLDRFGNLSGVANHAPDGTGFYDGFAGGDLLRAAPAGSGFVLERNGSVGELSSLSGVSTGQGPGGGEFYNGDDWQFFGRVAHDEVTNGSLALIPGKNEVVSTVFDPLDELYKSGGWRVYNNLSGAITRRFMAYANDPGTFGKAAGLGDIEAVCDPAPVEIGNRVWDDLNANGIQEATEPGLDGLVLHLYDGETQLASTTTTNGGQWYFHNGNVPGGLRFKHPYHVRMDMAQRPGDSLSPRQVSTDADSHLRDADAVVQVGQAVINVITGDAGQNNHNYDIGLFRCSARPHCFPITAQQVR